LRLRGAPCKSVIICRTDGACAAAMAPQAKRRKRRAMNRLVRGGMSMVFLVGLAYLIHRPLVQLYWGTYNRLQLGGTSRLFGGAASPTVTQWLASQHQQTGGPMSVSFSSRLGVFLFHLHTTTTVFHDSQFRVVHCRGA
jgi:hypothetical protein